jgi:hypothetical protein
MNGAAAGFAYDQQFAFSLLLPLAALAALISIVGKRGAVQIHTTSNS